MGRVLCARGWLSRAHCDLSGDTVKDQTVTVLLNSKWDCSDHQGSGPFPGLLEPHINSPGPCIILKVTASIMTRTGPTLPNLVGTAILI